MSLGEARTEEIFLGLDAVLGFGTVYLILLAIALESHYFPRAEFVVAAAMIGVFVMLKGGRLGLEDFLGHRVHAMPLELLLAGVFGALIWIAATKQMDY